MNQTDTLLTKARADTEIAAGDLEMGIEIYQTIREALPRVACENLLRLNFLTGREPAVTGLISDLEEKRRVFWRAVYDVRCGKYKWSAENSYIEAETVSDLAYLGLLYPPDQQEKALQAWMHYLETAETGWERSFVAGEALKRKPLTCQMCQTAQATNFQRDLPVCTGCLELIQDPEWFKNALKGEDSSAIELLENLSGESFSEPFDMEQLFPHQAEAEAAPLLRRLENLESFYPLFESELKACWGDAAELANRSQETLKPCHLWEAMHLHADSLSKSVHQDTLRDDRELYQRGDGQSDLLKILNVARWWDGLNPNIDSQGISLGTVYRSLAFGFDESRSSYYSAIFGMLGLWCNTRQASEFESLLTDFPDDIFLRLVLSNYNPTMEATAELNRHTLWLVNNRPQLAESSTSGALWLTSLKDYKTMLEAWTGALQGDPNNPKILAKAAEFFALSQPSLSLHLYQRAAELAPEDLTYRTQVGHALESVARETLNPESRTQLLLEAVAWCEQSLAQNRDPSHRSFFLVDAVQYAFRAGDWPRVESFANELLDEKDTEANWNQGNSVHYAHLALGHLALNKGDRKQAKLHLLAAADIKGSPQLKSFGPQFGLARRLLALGEVEVVSQYLRLCQNFWDMGHAYLEGWLAELQAGRIPDLAGFRGE
jgi:hypothetical protein